MNPKVLMAAAWAGLISLDIIGIADAQQWSRAALSS